MSERKGRRRLYSLPVELLEVPGPWLVGRARFRPRGWLAARAQARVPKAPGSWPRGIAQSTASEIGDLKSATVEVAATSGEEAYRIARESVAVLRLYQRHRYPHVDLDMQTFGLPGDVGTWLAPYFAASMNLPYLGGWARHGVLADFQFTREDRRAFLTVPTFAYLHNALRSDSRNDLEKRSLTALSIRHLITASRPDALRLPFVAVMMEALLGDDGPHDKAHRIAQLVAFTTCVAGCGRTTRACAVLRAKDRDAVQEQGDLARAKGLQGVCSAYDAVIGLFAARVETLHEARIEFEKREVRNRLYWTDRSLLLVLEWLVAAGATSWGDLDAARVAAVVAAGGPIEASKAWRQAKGATQQQRAASKAP